MKDGTPTFWDEGDAGLKAPPIQKGLPIPAPITDRPGDPLARVPRPGPHATSRKIYTVGELNRQAQQVLETSFAEVAVEGEVSLRPQDLEKARMSGYLRFTLKDAEAELPVVMWREAYTALRFKVEHGLKVVARGRLTLWAKGGRYQFIAGALEPAGLGALQLAFEQMKKRLEAEGLFAAERKRPIPALPARIGIVTSPTGAAVRDMLRLLKDGYPCAEILVCPAKVQGDGAAEEIAGRIAYLNERHADLDVLLVGRGGGSLEDLWCFNEEVLARAIVASRIPIISCVGHEVDFTIADFVADLRAPTPSAAAKHFVENRISALRRIREMRQRIEGRLKQTLGVLTESLRGALQSRVFTAPTAFLDDLRQEVGEALARLATQARHGVAMHEETLKRFSAHLNALSPLAVLGRGYAIAFGPDGRALADAGRVKPGDMVRVRLHRGELDADVTACRGGSHDPPE